MTRQDNHRTASTGAVREGGPLHVATSQKTNE
nr:MAG TPA: hypothetical protein [Caudoviricetes sp.]